MSDEGKMPERVWVRFDRWGIDGANEAEQDMAPWDRENPQDKPHVSEPYLRASLVRERFERLRGNVKAMTARYPGRTHYPGCEDRHELCAILSMIDAEKEGL